MWTPREQQSLSVAGWTPRPAAPGPMWTSRPNARRALLGYPMLELQIKRYTVETHYYVVYRANCELRPSSNITDNILERFGP